MSTGYINLNIAITKLSNYILKSIYYNNSDDCQSHIGPIASALTNKYGCRYVTILGSLLASFGFAVSVFAPNVYFLYVSIGLIAG